MMKTHVVIAGAGPAGSVCAWQLLRAGIDCILLDRAKFPRDKICGGGLTWKSYRLLEELYPGFHYDYNAVKHIRLTVNERHTCEFDAAEEVRIVQRRVFDNALLQQFIQAGGTFINKGLVSLREESDGKITVVVSGGEEISCNYVVGADGANSRVRKYLAGNTGKQVLAVEQYMPRQPKNMIEGALSYRYEGGYYYRFPNDKYDVVGFGDMNTTIKGFRQLLDEMGIAETKLRGAYVPLSTDYPLHDHIILIGDAGAFANRVTYEGLYYAFRTAMNAAEAIVKEQPFSKTNAIFFRKKRHEEIKRRVFYSRFGIAAIGFLTRWPRIVKYCFDRNV